MRDTTDEVTQTRQRQIELYGEPLQDVLGRCAAILRLTQVRMAEYLGISAPMLSQLINGHRIKIGNPAAAQRLQWMIQITRQVESGELGHDDAISQLENNAHKNDVFSNATTSTTGKRARHLAADVQELCRSVASAGEFIEAANTLRASHPEIAEFLHVFGAERADRAVDYTNRLRGS
ncbi:hypothetical protein [Granulicoccus phenolivorans]|uniref:hypothetical protein n=1 Tax=Granulicoccus phenolivorans TaxID=266854 RepID=UPI00047AEDCD|nr:hypothetical protein [Granulicoccus phenolivorans]